MTAPIFRNFGIVSRSTSPLWMKARRSRDIEVGHRTASRVNCWDSRVMIILPETKLHAGHWFVLDESRHPVRRNGCPLRRALPLVAQEHADRGEGPFQIGRAQSRAAAVPPLPGRRDGDLDPPAARELQGELLGRMPDLAPGPIGGGVPAARNALFHLHRSDVPVVMLLDGDVR